MTRKVLNRFALVALFAALVYALYAMPVADRVVALMAWVQAHPLEGALVYLACAVSGSVLFVPGSTWMLLAGYLFGFVAGAPIALLAVTLGAQAAFLAARLVARDWVAAKVANHRRLAAIEAVGGEYLGGGTSCVDAPFQRTVPEPVHALSTVQRAVKPMDRITMRTKNARGSCAIS